MRNALDHGIEDITKRRQLNKELTGTIELSAAQQAGSIVIKVIDDGRGIDAKLIETRAIEKKLLTKQHQLNQQQLIELIFH